MAQGLGLIATGLPGPVTDLLAAASERFFFILTARL